MTTFAQPTTRQIALLGGDEFTRDCEAIDISLIATLRKKTPRIGIVPTAIGHLKPYMVVSKAVSYFSKLGATAYGINIYNKTDANDSSLTRELLHADAIYLTGGDPLYLLRSTENSLFLATLLDIYRSGGLIIGSSAGAMVLCESMQIPPGVGEIFSGLNLIPKLCVLPHYENLAANFASDPKLAKTSSSMIPETNLIGIDSKTALFLDGKVCKVLGVGSVTIINSDNPQTYREGTSFNNLL